MGLNKIPLFISSEIALPPAGKDVLINTGYKYAIGSYNESDGCFWFDGDCWCKGNIEWADIDHIIDVVKDINENIENGKIVEKQNKAAELCEKCSDTSECPMFYPYLKEGDSDAES